MVRFLRARDRPDDANRLLDELLGEFPSANVVHECRAMELSGDDLDEAIRHFPEQSAYYEKRLKSRAKTNEQALADQDAIVKLSPDPGTARFRHGKLLMETKDYESAIADFDVAIAANGKLPDWYRWRAKAHYCLEHYDAALKDLAKIVELQPQASLLYPQFSVGLVAKCPNTSFRTGVLALVDEAVERGDNFLQRAALNEALGRIAEAHTDYDEAARRNPNSTLVRYERGRFLLKHSADYEEALADLDVALADNPGAEHWHRYKRRAAAHFLLGHFDEALQDVARAVELRPDDGHSLRYISYQLVARCPDEAFRNGMLELADKAVREADNEDVRYSRAGLLFALGRHDRALGDLEWVIERYPGDPNLIRERAKFLAELGRWNDAATDLGRVIELDPGATNGKYLDRHEYALLLLGAGDRTAYQREARAMLEAFEDSTLPMEAIYAAWTSSLV